MKRHSNTKAKIKLAMLGICLLAVIVLAFTLISCTVNKFKNNTQPTQTATPSTTPTETPVTSESPVAESPSPSATPQASETPDNALNIRTDYKNFSPNEAGEIPIIMFHRFIEAYAPDTEKDYTTTFAEFETLLQKLYDQGYRLISMQDFIDCNISVPAGTKPVVFTFDDGSEGQFNLINENGTLRVNPRSAVGIMKAFSEKHPDFGLKGIFYVYMDAGDSIFKGEGTLKERFETMESLGLEIGNHTWGHVDYKKITTADKIKESLGKNQQKAEELLPGLRFYSLALPYGSRPKDESLWPFLQEGTYNGTNYRNETIMAVGANPSVPSISKAYNSLYVRRIRAQGRVAVDADLTWWLPRMTNDRMFISDGDPKTIVVPAEKPGNIDEKKLMDKKLITY